VADEIRLVKIERIQHRRNRTGIVFCIFLHPLTPRLRTDGGVVIVPTPSQNLPGEVLAQQLIPQAQITDIDAGALAWEEMTVRVTAADLQSLPAIVPKLKIAYQASDLVRELRRRYKHTGKAWDAP